MADVDDEVFCEAVAMRCTLDELLIALNVLPERYGIPTVVVPERFDGRTRFDVGGAWIKYDQRFQPCRLKFPLGEIRDEAT